MSQRYKGAVISATPPTTTSGNSGTAPGIWTMQQQLQAQGANAWPSFTPVYIEDLFSTYLYTGNGTSQSINNGIALGNSNGGGSVLFDGAGDWLSVASSSGFNLGTGDFTVECWVYRTAASGGYETMLGFDVTGGLLFELYGNQLDFGIRGTANNTSGVTVPSYQWVHLALARQSGVVRYFQNGSLIYTYTGTYATQNFTNNTAALVSSYSPGAGVFNGYISNLRLVKGTALYTSSFTPSTSPLTAVSGTSLLTCQGNTPFVDNSGNALAITRNGDSSAQVSGPFTVTGVGQGGLVWLKSRTANGASSHYLVDTVRGPQSFLFSNLNWAASTYPAGYFSFLVNGFNLNDGGGNYNINAINYASWTFRKQPKFFDVVTYTGNGVAGRQISHNLGSVPGCIIVKCTSGSANWLVWHRSSSNEILSLNLTDAYIPAYSQYIRNADASNFTIATAAQPSAGTVNASGESYVAYIFAHDAGGFGTAGTDNVISCGSVTTDSGTGIGTVNLGYEPQWVLYKRTDAAGNWNLLDNMRGWYATTQSGATLFANSSLDEASIGGQGSPASYPNATGFTINGSGSQTFIYIAIRRGPMKTPTSGTSVFNVVSRTGNGTSGAVVDAGFPVDLAFVKRNTSGYPGAWEDRLRGNNTFLSPNLTDQEYNGGNTIRFTTNQNGVSLGTDSWVNSSSQTYFNFFFRRAAGFFDEVCYTGTGSATTVTHNLTVTPELIIVKRRDQSGWNWAVYASGSPGTLLLDQTLAAQTSGYYAGCFTSTSSTTFGVNTIGEVNGSGGTYVGYLFASCPGVSKVGSYTGTGGTQTISCGFAARWVMIKRTDSTGNWWYWDTTRGMVSGTDPRLAMNTNDAQTNADWVYTNASGFQIVTTDATVNASGGSYIYLAIA